MKTLSIAFIVIGAALVTVACGARQEFTPAEKATARSPEGYSAAEYQIGDKEGVLAMVKVWSNGAYRRTIRGEQRTVIHVGFAIENFSDEALSVNTEDLRLDLGVLDKRVFDNLKPTLASGMMVVAGGLQQRFDVYFALPRDVSPRQVNAFQIKWKLGNDKIHYAQETPFLENEVERYAYYYTPFYDPFIYDYYFYHPHIVIHRFPYRHYHIYR